MNVHRPVTFRVESPDEGRVRALLAADHAYHRVRHHRRLGVTALALAGCAAWFDWWLEGAMRRLVLTGWLTVLVFTVAAAIAEISAWRRLQEAIEETKR